MARAAHVRGTRRQGLPRSIQGQVRIMPGRALSFEGRGPRRPGPPPPGFRVERASGPPSRRRAAQRLMLDRVVLGKGWVAGPGVEGGGGNETGGYASGMVTLALAVRAG